MSGSHCTPHWGAAIHLKQKKSNSGQFPLVELLVIVGHLAVINCATWINCGTLKRSWYWGESSQETGKTFFNYFGDPPGDVCGATCPNPG